MVKRYIWLLPIIMPLTGVAKDIDIGIPAIKRDIGSYEITSDSIPLSAIQNSQTITVDTSSTRSMLSESVTTNTADKHSGAEDTLTNTYKELRPLRASCVMEASEFYGIHQDILYALLLAEGGTVGETSKENKNGTKDINLFQMNESNLPELAKEFGITKEQLMNDGCLGVAVAARHLLRSVEGKPVPTDSHSYLKYLALYHNANEPWNEIYANKLRTKFEFLANVDAKYNRQESDQRVTDSIGNPLDNGVQQ